MLTAAQQVTELICGHLDPDAVATITTTAGVVEVRAWKADDDHPAIAVAWLQIDTHGNVDRCPIGGAGSYVCLAEARGDGGRLPPNCEWYEYARGAYARTGLLPHVVCEAQRTIRRAARALLLVVA